LKDEGKAIFWITKAARQGNLDAQRELACAYASDYGYGATPKDYVRALYWLTKAAQQGSYLEQYKLGNMYYDGIETQRDRVKAAYWWRNSAKQGSYYAQFSLGMLYYDGIGVIQSYKFAYIWCGLAATYPVYDPGFSKKRELAQEIRELSEKKLSPLQLLEAQEFMSTMQDKFFRSQH
jgi:TPR repeat protein